jgi:hypothetical protein
MAEKADVWGDNDVFDTLTLLTMLTLSRLEVVGTSEHRCAVLTLSTKSTMSSVKRA